MNEDLQLFGWWSDTVSMRQRCRLLLLLLVWCWSDMSQLCIKKAANAESHRQPTVQICSCSCLSHWKGCTLILSTSNASWVTVRVVSALFARSFRLNSRLIRHFERLLQDLMDWIWFTEGSRSLALIRELSIAVVLKSKSKKTAKPHLCFFHFLMPFADIHVSDLFYLLLSCSKPFFYWQHETLRSTTLQCGIRPGFTFGNSYIKRDSFEKESWKNVPGLAMPHIPRS